MDEVTVRIDGVRGLGTDALQVQVPSALAAALGVSEGRLSLPGFLALEAPVEPHAHLDKAFLADTGHRGGGDLDSAIEAMGTVTLTAGDVARRAARAIDMALLHGTSAIRTHVDVGPHRPTASIEAAAAHRPSGLDLERVALVGAPISGEAGRASRRALERAIEAGVELVGGAPWLDPRPAEAMRILAKAATEAGLGMDLHLDETTDPSVQTVEALLDIREAGFAGPLTASHLVSLARSDPKRLAKVAARLADAHIGVVALPMTNLYLQGRAAPGSPPRAIAPIAALRDAGVVVAAGGDNLRDPFYPLGAADPLEVAAYLVTAAHLDPEGAWDLVSAGARSLLLTPGSARNLLLVEAVDLVDALASRDASRLLVLDGRLCAASVTRRYLAEGPREPT